MIKKKCEQCEKEFISPNVHHRKYCSHKCYIESTRTGEYRKCKICNKEFYATKVLIDNGQGIYCSQKCSAKDREKRKIIKCLFCGKEFVLKKISQKNRKFCSRQCCGKYKKGKKIKSYGKNVKRKCLFCGKIFKVRKSVIKKGYGKYCCRKCCSDDKTIEFKCDNCGKTIKKKKSEKKGLKNNFCSRECHYEFISTSYEKECKVCGKIFKVKKNLEKLGWGEFCSNECRAFYRKHKNILFCKTCGKKIFIQNCQIGKKYYCSKECFLRGNGTYPSSIEIKIKEFLIKSNITFETQFNLGKYYYDFLIINKNRKNVLIEADGDFYHANMNRDFNKKRLYPLQIKSIKRDKLKNKLASEKGYKLLRLWEYDINNNFEACKKKILDNI